MIVEKHMIGQTVIVQYMKMPTAYLVYYKRYRNYVLQRRVGSETASSEGLVLFSSRFCRPSCAITQSERSRHLKRPSPHTIANARRVACHNAPKCTHPASKYFRICQHGILL